MALVEGSSCISVKHTSLFFSDVWEQKPLLIKRHHLAYNDGWFSTKEMDDILRKVNMVNLSLFEMIVFVCKHNTSACRLKIFIIM